MNIYLFIIKTQQWRNKWNISQSDKGYLFKNYSKNHTGEILNTFMTKIGNQAKGPFSCYFLFNFGAIVKRQQTNKQKIQVKCIQTGKEKVKCHDYVENPKKFTKQLLQLTNEVSKLIKFKVNIQ